MNRPFGLNNSLEKTAKLINEILRAISLVLDYLTYTCLTDWFTATTLQHIQSHAKRAVGRVVVIFRSVNRKNNDIIGT